MKKQKRIAISIASSLMVATPIIAASCGSTSKKDEQKIHSIYNQGRRTLLLFRDKSKASKEQRRIWDLSVQAVSLAYNSNYSPLIASIIDKTVEQSSLVVQGPDGKKKEVNKKISKSSFGTVSSISTSKKTFDNYSELVKNLSSEKTKEFTFKVKPGIHYVNSKGEVTKYNYKAIDLFYGYIRGIYNNAEVRKQGTINGKNKITPLEDAYMKKVKNSTEFYQNGKLNSRGYDNGNVYLNNLFGIDIKATIDANTGTNFDENKFTIKFQSPQDAAILDNFFTRSQFFHPVSSEKILELNGGYKNFDKPGKFTQILEYGKLIRKNEKVDLSDLLTIGKFYLANYDRDTQSDGIVIKKNEHSYDEKYNKNNRTLKKIQTIYYDPKDADAFNQERKKRFLEDNSESLLFANVKENSTLMEEIKSKGYGEQRRSFEKSLINSVVMNPWYMVSTGNKDALLDDNTSKLLFGTTTKDAQMNPEADDEYFSGRGRIFRSLLNSSINLFGISNQWLPGSSLSKVANYYEPGLNFSTGQTLLGAEEKYPRLGIEHGIATDVEQMQYFIKNNSKEKDVFLKPTEKKYEAVRAGWKNFINNSKQKLGIKGDFVFPLYDYRGTDVKETPATTNAYNTIIKQLNLVTKGLGITFKKFVPKNDKNTNAINKFLTAPVVYVGAGADYDSSISLTQQLLSAYYGYALMPYLVRKALQSKDNSVPTFLENNQNDWNIDGKVSIKDFIDYLKVNKDQYKHALNLGALNKFTLKDWISYRSGGNFNNEDVKLTVNEIDSAAQKFFFSIVGNEKSAVKWTRLLGDYSMADKLSIGYKAYASLGSKPNSTMQTNTIYTAPWLHLASNAIGETMNLLDTYVDLE
ncbi:OppA family ABC transporter substrate-binding lipoprotein [Mycoplasma marinum]|uniref:Lipoprotein n=1 Tax=Mycoplasma marinum TaxID=1937190 RepID=A0A4R0XK86_9MOLU|nr:hypothetical protein [Mycoplasma marinum]TCG11053.1 hypothetical protein C4B24_03145 [Mycoplasma marinum]